MTFEKKEKFHDCLWKGQVVFGPCCFFRMDLEVPLRLLCQRSPPEVDLQKEFPSPSSRLSFTPISQNS
jgi:hypothetical protein